MKTTRPLASDGSANPAGLRSVPEDLEGTLRREGFTLGDWQVQPLRNRIVSDLGERALDPRLIDVLVAFASRPGEVWTRDELLARVWHDSFVAENTLSQAISRLRKALGDDRTRPAYIETISKSGYRLVAAVSWKGAAGPPRVVAPSADGEQPAVASTAVPSRVLWGLAFGLIAVSAVVGFSLRRSGPASPPPTPQPVPTVRPALTLVGQQFGPRLSPDGERIAFAWQGPEQAGWDIWVHRVGGDNPARLTDHPHDERLASWSPDGQEVAFARFSDAEGVCGIFRVPLLGGPAERLGDCMPGMRSLVWAPDGSALVLSGIPEGAQSRALFRHDLNSGERVQLTTPGDAEDLDAVFSPDAQSIAFIRRHGPFRHDAMVLASAGGEPRALTADRWGQLRGVAWNSKGDSVFFSSNRVGNFALWSVPSAGGEPTRLPIQDSWVTQPSVARSGGRLIYRTFRDSVDIWELPLDAEGNVAGEPIRRVPSSRSERHPAWAPGDDAVAFVSDRGGSRELWSGRPDGTELMRHTDLAGPLPGSPAWSPDGQTLIYDAAVDGHADLWLVARDSRQSRRLTDEPSEERNGSFSRDGKRIYFSSNRGGAWNIWQLPAAGGPAEQVTLDGGFLAGESPDGTQLYHVKLEQPGIWRMPVEGGSSELVLDDLDLSDWGSWVVGERGIYYVRRGPTTIGFLPFDGGEPRLIHTPPKQMPYLGRALSLSGDGRSLLFSLIDHSDDEVMAVDMAGL